MSDRPIRLCLATLEHDHAWWTLEHIISAPEVELVGVLDASPQRVNRFRVETKSAAPVFEDLAAMLEAVRPDGLVVTAPNNDHREFASVALGRGIHCLVQKPMATSVGDARSMVDAAMSSGKQLMVNHFPLWQPPRAEFFRQIAAGRIGTVRHLSTWNGHQGPVGISVLTDDYIRWLYDRRKHGGGVLADQANYGIAYSAWMLGRPLRVSATAVDVETRAQGVDDIAVVTLEYPGAIAQLQGSWGWPHRIDEMRCIGSEGRIDLIDGVVSVRSATTTIHQVPDPSVISPDNIVPPSAAHGVAHFVSCIRNGEAVAEPHTAAMNLLVTEITDAALLASRENRTVSFN